MGWQNFLNIILRNGVHNCHKTDNKEKSSTVVSIFQGWNKGQLRVCSFLEDLHVLIWCFSLAEGVLRRMKTNDKFKFTTQHEYEELGSAVTSKCTVWWRFTRGWRRWMFWWTPPLNANQRPSYLTRQILALPWPALRTLRRCSSWFTALVLFELGSGPAGMFKRFLCT